MKIVADTVHPDEPCWGLYEGPQKMPRVNKYGKPYTENRWVQVVRVIRGDAIALYATDLGAVEDYPDTAPLLMPSFGDDTVAQLQEAAERERYSDFARKHREKVAAESTLMADVVRNIERRREEARNRTSIGPAVFVQRGNYSRTRTERKIRDKQRAYKEAN